MFLKLFISQNGHFAAPSKNNNIREFVDSEFVKICNVQLNEYEPAPHFIQLIQNLTSDCWLI